MNIIEIAQVSLKNLSRQGLRSALTLIGVIIGVAAIVTLVSLGSGLNNAVNKQFEQLGSNTIFLAPGTASIGGGNNQRVATNITGLKDSQIQKIKAIPEVESVITPISGNGTVKFGKDVAKIPVFAADSKEAESFEDIGFLEIEEGRNIQTSDGFVAIIGPTVQKDIFSKEIRLRDRIEIQGKSFRVIGVTKKTSTSFGGGPNTNNSIFISKKTFKEIFPNIEPVFALIKIKKKEDISVAKEKIDKIFEKDYGKNQKEFQTITSEQVIERIGQVLGVIQLFLVGIASISLLVGSIGIMNTMFMAVMERTKEIGVMKAVGATNNLVLSIFVLEAGFIGLAGGIIGVIIGYVLAFFIGYVANISGFALIVELDPFLIVGSLLFSMIIGMVAGALPANRAASLDPVEALRGPE
jgi:putative ABC transport system permease protein